MIVSRNTLNFMIDSIMFVTALGLVTTGLLIKFVIPAGSTRHGLVLWGWDRHDWGDVHFWLAMTVIGLVVVHLVMHWQWVCTTVKRLCVGSGRGAPLLWKRSLVGLAVLVAAVGLIGGSLWLAETNLQTDAASPGRGDVVVHAEPDVSRLQGSMTLREAATQLGVEPAEVVAALSLPADTDPDQRLGHLARDHGMRMRDVRDTLSHLTDD